MDLKQLHKFMANASKREAELREKASAEKQKVTNHKEKQDGRKGD